MDPIFYRINLRKFDAGTLLRISNIRQSVIQTSHIRKYKYSSIRCDFYTNDFYSNVTLVGIPKKRISGYQSLKKYDLISGHFDIWILQYPDT